MIDLTESEAVFESIQQRLADLSSAIKQSQEPRDGSVLLGLYRCGKHCDMCPHPRWEKWVGRNKITGKYRWYGVKIESPLRVISGNRRYPDETKEAIREAVRLIKLRNGLSEDIQRLRNRTRLIKPHL